MPDWSIRHGIASAQHLLRVAQQHGAPLATCLAGSGVSAAMVADAESEITVEQELRLIRNVVAALPNADGLAIDVGLRYQLTDFGLGFMRLAMETKTPVVPIAVIGAEEQYVSVANLDRAARLMGMPAFPLLPQLVLPGGFMPLPTKYRLYYGEPMYFDGDADDEDAVIEEKVWLVRATIQSMLNRGLKARKTIFW